MTGRSPSTTFALVDLSVTTKQPQPHRKRDWYPYYAGFPDGFVKAAIHSYFESAESMLDPWNGSGTTTAISALKGLSPSGIDINPSATIIARARLTPMSIKESLIPIAEEITVAAQRSRVPGREVEPLTTWLRRPAVEGLRRLQHAVHEVLTSDDTLEASLAAEPEEASNAMGLLPSFYYTALFATARDLLEPFKATNPTWLKDPPSQLHRLNPSYERTSRLFIDRVAYLCDRLILPEEVVGAASRIWTGSALDVEAVDVYDACLTSPPYATRVDYVRNTLAELAVLGLGKEQIKTLRRRTTGTPVVKGVQSEEPTWSSAAAQQVVDGIRSHKSHGSANYYAPWIRNYLADLQRTLERINSAVKQDGVVGLVVQDSYYKEIHVDLQLIVTETMEHFGRTVDSRVDYLVDRSLTQVNPSVWTHRDHRTPRESLLVFGSGVGESS